MSFSTLLNSDTTQVANAVSSTLKSNSITLEALQDFAVNALSVYVPRIIVAVIILWVGLRLIKLVDRNLAKMMKRHDIDPSVVSFSKATIDIVLKVLLGIAVITKLGVPGSSFIALLGAAGLAIGLAMQGTLQNFAGGFIILLFKPFKLEDDIEFGGSRGIVKQIQIFYTIIETPINNKTIIVPNSQIASNTLINYSKVRLRRLDAVYSIAYGQSVDQARDIIDELVKSDSRLVGNPDYDIVVSSLSDNSVDMTVRAWVVPSDYFAVLYSLNEKVYKRFTEEGIDIPFPQLQIHHTKEA